MSHQSVRVTVVVPFWNAERFMRESLDSVLAQTYDAWELILVDDGSTDGSTAIAHEYVRRDPARIRYLEHPGHANRGVPASRNVGVAHARGEYVAELDADDVWLPGKLAHAVPLLDAHPDVGMLYGAQLYWYSWSGAPADAARDHVPAVGPPTNAVVDPLDLLLRHLHGTVASPAPCGVVLRKSVLQRVGGSEESFLGMNEDLALYAKMMVAAPVYVVDGWLERYRCYSGPSNTLTVIAQQTGTAVATHERYLEWLADYLHRHGLGDSEHRRYVLETLQARRAPRAVGSMAALPQPVGRAIGHAVRRAMAVAERVPGLRRVVRHARRRLAGPAVGKVRMGDLRRVEPINRHWGWERGQPVDRYFIERFLAEQADAIRGRVLEVGDDAYTRQFGGARVTQRDVLHVQPGNPIATVIADLTDADHVPSDAFDCIILTQTLHLVYDVRSAMRTLYRVLRPGGTLLLTAPGISQTTDDNWRDSWHWAFTANSMRRLAAECFPADRVRVESRGNVLTAIAFLHGLAREELRADELAAVDRDFPLLITLCATKPAA